MFSFLLVVSQKNFLLDKVIERMFCVFIVQNLLVRNIKLTA